MKVRIVLIDLGQKPASQDNFVQVQLSAQLPTGADNFCDLTPELRFDTKLTFFGSDLSSLWGLWQEKGIRTCDSPPFAAATYKEAIEKAWQYATIEVERLRQAIHERTTALVKAGKFVPETRDFELSPAQVNPKKK